MTAGLRVERLAGNPIVRPHMDDRMGDNINGPSLVRAPSWVQQPLGRYYLYFAHHLGQYIRLAYADELTGPWTLHTPGVLALEDSLFPTGPVDDRASTLPAGWSSRFPWHIASPDVHVDDDTQRVRMYFHGLHDQRGSQMTRLAVSDDGVSFTVRPEILTPSYLRVFEHGDSFYGISHPLHGRLHRSADGASGFEAGQDLLPQVRHVAVHVRDGEALVFFTRVGDEPERILAGRMPLAGHWRSWRVQDVVEVLRPQTDWEGGVEPLRPSRSGASPGPENALRDPCVFVDDDGRTYLLYSVAGERGIAIAHLGL